MATDTIREPNPRNVKIVAEVKERLEASPTIIAAEYRGLNVPQQAELRAKVKAAGGELKIYKNTLVRRAAGEVGVDIDEHLTGPTALALVDVDGDSAAMAKALQEFADDNDNFVIKGGVMDGAALDADNVKALSKIPPRDVLLSQIAGVFAAPMTKFASLLQAMPRDFASLIKALHEKGGGAEASAAPADDADAPAEADAAADTSSEEAAPVASDETEEAPAAEAADAPEEAPEETESPAEAAGSEEEE